MKHGVSEVLTLTINIMRKKLKQKRLLDQMAKNCVEQMINNIRDNKPLYTITFDVPADTIAGLSIRINSDDTPVYYGMVSSFGKTVKEMRKILMHFVHYVEKWLSIYEEKLNEAAESTTTMPLFVSDNTLHSIVNMIKEDNS